MDTRPMEIVDYRDFLRSEFEGRKQAKMQYSLRAFARDAGTSIAFLSQLISHKRNLSVEKAFQLGTHLGWEPEKIKFFSTLVRYQNCAQPLSKSNIEKELKIFRKKYPLYYNLKVEQFRLISDWWHFAILELSELNNFRSDALWISKRLGISVTETQDAISRLKRLGLLVETVRGYRKSQNNYKIANVASQAIQNFHKQNLERARSAIEKQPLSEREFLGATMAIDPKNIPLAKKKISQFTSELMSLLEKGDKKVIYHFSSQLFRAQEL
jgi:uncharacterized protein (TIGR02147 family)